MATLRMPLLLAFCAVSFAAATAESAPPATFPAETWEEAMPASQGVDPGKLEAAVDLLARTVGNDATKELVIIKNGRFIWRGDDIDKRHGVWSATKSFTSTVLGLFIEDRKCNLDTRLADVLPEMKTHYPDVTLRHLTTMTSGYRAVGDTMTGTYKHGPSTTPFQPNPMPLFTPPGSQYAYWDSAMNVFGLALTKIAGEPLEALFRRRIADPIGMRDWDWGDYATIDGVVINGGSGNSSKHVFITAREMARFGLLFLNKGNWNGRQLISPEWIDQATRVQVPFSLPWAQPESEIDGRGVYGFNWWVNGLKPDGERKFSGAPEGLFWASGHNNNKCFIIPEWNMVIVRLGLDGRAKDEVWNGFLTQVRAAVTDASAIRAHNGPWLTRKENGGSAGPLRGGKTSTWEGGVRVPAIAWAPGCIAPGQTCNRISSTLDLLPTLSRLAGSKLPANKLDGRDLSAWLLHGAPPDEDTAVHLFHVETHLQAVRQGRWKLHLPRPYPVPWLSRGLQRAHVADVDRFEITTPLLYDLAADIGEKSDVAAQHPDVVKSLLALAEKSRTEIGDYDCIGSEARFFDEGPKRPDMDAWKSEQEKARPPKAEKDTAQAAIPMPPSPTSTPTTSPNIVLIVANDYGYGKLPPITSKPKQPMAELPPLKGEKLIDLPLIELPPKPWSTSSGPWVAGDGVVWIVTK